MGMSCAIWQVADEITDDLIKDPAIGEEVLAELIEYNDELKAEQKVYLDLDKAWHGISYLLTKKSIGKYPAFLEKGGIDITGIDQGYGCARSFRNQDAKEIYLSIKGLTFEELRKGVTVKDLINSKIYPFMEDETDAQAFGYLKVHWNNLLKFLASTTANKRELLLYLF